jgi:hypothetical protein
MNKKVITIGGVKWEVDDEDPSYKKRITPEFTTIEAMK